ncbi:acetylglutamate kinase [Rummeliibacillus suwonensis]|uniref:acetylglutamate kinase n=1 Tax=Rummeliibacillus suwonensis TaxID=1306154 RepID=UPI002896DEE0|nr:acetylglutamate kinase [Rummeliibacillus suwonensis]
MTMSKSMPHTDHKKLVIKLGGSMLAGLDPSFFATLKNHLAKGDEIIIVHGGGLAINAALQDSNIAYKTVNGIRFTSKEAVGIVQKALVDQVNPLLTNELNASGIQSIGLNGIDGTIFESDFLDKSTYGYVGKIKNVHHETIQKYLEEGKLPVIACFGATEEGIPLNINGDTVASELALALDADALLLVTDTAGIKINDEVQKEVNPEKIRQWIQSEDIYGGMIPKVQAAIECLEAGIPAIHIVNQHFEGTKISKEGVLL